MRPIKVQKVGADPEVFLKTKDGKPFSVEGLLGGTKAFPLEIQGLPAGFFVQEDNVAMEFNIPASGTANEFSVNIARGLKYLKKVANANSLDLAFVSALEFNMQQLQSTQAKTLGCEPDFNVWLNRPNPRPRPPETLRTAAGHVHISWEKPDDEQILLYGKTLDVFLGLPSLLVTEHNQRRSLYGRAGAIRKKDYGLEYRVLGNEWLDQKEWRLHVFNNVMAAANTLNKKCGVLVEMFEEQGDLIQDTINNHDVDMALQLMENYDVAPFPFIAHA